MSSDKPNQQSTESKTTSSGSSQNDSLGIPVEKSPWLIYALLQIPIVIIMIALLYFGYQSFKDSH